MGHDIHISIEGGYQLKDAIHAGSKAQDNLKDSRNYGLQHPCVSVVFQAFWWITTLKCGAASYASTTSPSLLTSERVRPEAAFVVSL